MPGDHVLRAVDMRRTATSTLQIVGTAQRASVTWHVLGEQVMENAVAEPLPVHICGPLSAMLPFASIVPVKPSNGGAKVSAQLFSVMTTAEPMSDASQ
jgi:hypothetical protein